MQTICIQLLTFQCKQERQNKCASSRVKDCKVKVACELTRWLEAAPDT